MTYEEAVREAVREFLIHDVNKPSWFTDQQNEQLVRRIVSASKDAAPHEECPTCGGTGEVAGPGIQCNTCFGAGKIFRPAPLVRRTIDG